MNLFLTSTPDAATPGIGMAAAAAGSLVGTYWFLMMCGRLIGGVIGGKVSSKAQLTAVSVVALVFVLLGIFASDRLDGPHAGVHGYGLRHDRGSHRRHVPHAVAVSARR